MSDIPPDCTVGGPAHRPGVTYRGQVRCLDCKVLLEEPICDDCGRAIVDCDADPVVKETDHYSYVFGHYTTETTCPRIVREDEDERADHFIRMREKGA